MNRLRTLTEGRAMVVTDLHGDWELYSKYRDYFLNLHLPSILFSHLLHTSLVSYGKS